MWLGLLGSRSYLKSVLNIFYCSVLLQNGPLPGLLSPGCQIPVSRLWRHQLFSGVRPDPQEGDRVRRRPEEKSVRAHREVLWSRNAERWVDRDVILRKTWLVTLTLKTVKCSAWLMLPLCLLGLVDIANCGVAIVLFTAPRLFPDNKFPDRHFPDSIILTYYFPDHKLKTVIFKT